MQILADPVKAFILQRMARHDPLWRIAASVEGNFNVAVDAAQILDCWRDRNTSSTTTEPRPESTTTTGPRLESATTTEPRPESTTTTGPRLESATTTQPRPESTTTTGPGPGSTTTTQPRQDEEPMAILTDEIKEFIVRGLARYETPLQVATAVKVNFGIEISRQQVHEYNPMSSRPPALRWCELHAVTREKFLADVSGVGIAQKVVRLRMLDHFAQQAMEHNQFIKAAAFMEQAAKECGGIYESRKSAAAPRELPPKGPGL
jgi:hypothetical protein